jgi:hypothetical protein
MKIMMLSLCVLVLLVVGVQLLAAPATALDSYRRTRTRWPWAMAIWIVFAGACELTSLGMGMCLAPLLVGVVRSSSGIPLLSRPDWLSVMLWVGFGLAAFGGALLITWSHTLYGPMRRRYGPVKSQQW